MRTGVVFCKGEGKRGIIRLIQLGCRRFSSVGSQWIILWYMEQGIWTDNRKWFSWTIDCATGKAARLFKLHLLV